MKSNSLFSLILTLFLISCSSMDIPQRSVSESLHPQDVDVLVSAVAGDIYNKSANLKQTISYNNSFNNIYVYGVDRQRIKSLINGINPDYFAGLNQIEVIHSKKQDALRAADGWYYPDNAKIAIYIYDESDGWVLGLLLHELKHHYCWNKEKDLGHDKCFLDTPIDKEYGIVR